MPKYTVNLVVWNRFQLCNVEARSAEEAQEIAADTFHDAEDCDIVDSGIDSNEAELDG